MNLLTAVNPGQYTAPALSATYLLWGMVIGVVIALLIAIPVSVSVVRRGRSGWVLMAAFSIVIMLAGASMGTLILGSIGINVQADQGKTAATQYQSSVRTWLTDDYKITVTADEAKALAAGKTMATQVNSVLTVIHIIPVTGGDLALVDSGEHVISPVR